MVTWLEQIPAELLPAIPVVMVLLSLTAAVAIFPLPENSVRLRPGAHRLLDLIYTADLLSGAEAVRSGLFSRAMPAEELVDFTRAKAAAAAAGATLAFRESKELVRRLRDERIGLWESLDEENRAQGRLCASSDYAEGFAAFQAKRTPQFRGH